MSTTKPVPVPPYRLHKSSGRGYVNLNRRRVYLGRYDLPESRAKYDRLVAEWLANGRQRQVDPASLTVNELALQYWQHTCGGVQPAGA